MEHGSRIVADKPIVYFNSEGRSIYVSNLNPIVAKVVLDAVLTVLYTFAEEAASKKELEA